MQINSNNIFHKNVWKAMHLYELRQAPSHCIGFFVFLTLFSISILNWIVHVMVLEIELHHYIVEHQIFFYCNFIWTHKLHAPDAKIYEKNMNMHMFNVLKLELIISDKENEQDRIQSQGIHLHAPEVIPNSHPFFVWNI